VQVLPKGAACGLPHIIDRKLVLKIEILKLLKLPSTAQLKRQNKNKSG
jgi:hypothetical protein